MSATQTLEAVRGDLKAVRQEFTPGREFDITNHYITREDHACYGTRRVRVERTNTTRVYFEGERWGIEWPRAADVERCGDEIRFYGGGIGQDRAELFLTFRAVAS